MRRSIVLLLLLLNLYSPAFAQTSTPTPTNTPSPTPTPPPTPELGIYVTVIAPGDPPEAAQDGELKFTVDAGEVLIAIPLLGLFLTRLLDFILRARGRDA